MIYRQIPSSAVQEITDYCYANGVDYCVWCLHEDGEVTEIGIETWSGVPNEVAKRHCEAVGMEFDSDYTERAEEIWRVPEDEDVDTEVFPAEVIDEAEELAEFCEDDDFGYTFLDEES